VPPGNRVTKTDPMICRQPDEPPLALGATLRADMGPFGKNRRGTGKSDYRCTGRNAAPLLTGYHSCGSITAKFRQWDGAGCAQDHVAVGLCGARQNA